MCFHFNELEFHISRENVIFSWWLWFNQTRIYTHLVMFLEWHPYWIITFFLDNHKNPWDLWHKFYLIDSWFDFAPIFIRKHVGILSAYTKLSSRLCKTIISLFQTAYPLPVNYYPSNPKTIMSSIPRKWGMCCKK